MTEQARTLFSRSSGQPGERPELGLLENGPGTDLRKWLGQVGDLELSVTGKLLADTALGTDDILA